MAELTVRAGHPDFLDLPWDTSIVAWDVPHMITLPKGISRHEVRFFQYREGIYVVKELSVRAARQDYSVLRALESSGAPAVTPVGVVEGRHPDRHAEQSAALITEYEPFSFSYRELLAGPGFGPRRTQMLNAFAELLVELHLVGVFWGTARCRTCSTASTPRRSRPSWWTPRRPNCSTGVLSRTGTDSRTSRS
jgi:hypothetical protein